VAKSQPYQIDELPDEASQLRPVVRLARLLFRTCLEAGCAELRLRAATGGAEVMKDGRWTPIMKFPTPVYDGLVDQIMTITGVSHLTAGSPVPVRLHWSGRDVFTTMTPVGSAATVEEIRFQFESATAAE